MELIQTDVGHQAYADKAAGIAAILINGFDYDRVLVAPGVLECVAPLQGDYELVFKSLVDLCMCATEHIELEKARQYSEMGKVVGGACNAAFSGLVLRTLQAMRDSRGQLGLPLSLLRRMGEKFAEEARHHVVGKRIALSPSQARALVGGCVMGVMGGGGVL